MELVLAGEIRSNFEGYNLLNTLAYQCENLFLDFVNIDMSGVSWFDANMSASLGAILHKLSIDLNTVKLTQINAQVEKILSKNGFLSNYGRQKKHDNFGTTIEYRRFEPTDTKDFGNYIDKYINRQEMLRMTEGLKREFRRSVFEVFNNAVVHSNTRSGIFACGQYYPKVSHLDFSIVDLGIGFKNHLKAQCAIDLSPDEAIAWAIEKRNTSKTGRIPGGLGLKLILRLIQLNRGKLQIVSDGGFWEMSKDGPIMRKFDYPFPGTVVNIQVNTADTKIYSSEMGKIYEDAV